MKLDSIFVLILGCNLKSLLANNDFLGNEYKSYNDLLKKFVCDQPNESCYLRTCQKCPDKSEIKEFLEKVFEDNEVEEISYKAWVSTDRCKFINVVSDSAEFIDSLVESFESLVQHDYIAKAQSKCYRQFKNDLKEGEVLATLDFAENYPVVVQEEVQGHYWNNSQISILPSVIYYKENGIVKNLSTVGVLENNTHDTVSVYMFQKQLVELIKLKIPNVKKVIYFSDGAPQQFKNKKNFRNLCLHHQDFSIDAEWHFFATAHGKGPCDGLGGMVKFQARRACLQFASRRNILTSLEFYEWGKNHFKSVEFIHCTDEDYTSTSKDLETRFQNLKPIKGTQKMHTFIPEKNQHNEILRLKTKTVSSSTETRVFKVV